jgi:hypothetical protein
MEINGQLHALAVLSPGKTPLISISIRGLMGPRAGLDAMEKREISFLCREENPGRSVRSLVAIPTVICSSERIIHYNSGDPTLNSHHRISLKPNTCGSGSGSCPFVGFDISGGCTTDQAVSRQISTTATPVRSQLGTCGVSCEQSDNRSVCINHPVVNGLYSRH